MKKILYIFTIFTVFCISCSEDWLELRPTTEISSTESIKTVKDANYAINGIYSTFQSYEYYGARMQYYGDVTGDDMQATGTNKRSSDFYMMMTNTDDVYTSLWAIPHKVIRYANSILLQIDGLAVATTDQAQKDDIKGQALAIRALALFDVTRVYGYTYLKDNGASLGGCIITSVAEPNYQPKRNTVSECYDQIIKDLTDAIPLLQEKKNNGKINKWAAKSLLSRVYLYKGDNANALIEAEEAITGALANGYKLWTNSEYATGTGSWKASLTSEGLFEIINSSGDRAGNDGIAYLLSPNGYNDIVLTQDFLTLLDEDPLDARHNITLISTSASSFNPTEPIYLLKYTGPDPADIRNGNVTVLRLSETYLNAAEAAVKLSDNAKAIAYLNPIVNRANPANTVSGTVTLAQVIKERRKELVGEGHRQFDALRNNETLVRIGGWHISGLIAETTSYNRDYFHSILPIPKYEMDANPNMDQNPGYSE